MAAGEVREDLPAVWISQGSKSSIQCSRGIFNHLVNYVAARFPTCKYFFL
jgi:hypothetical protein